jgi:hypothetical protein
MPTRSFGLRVTFVGLLVSGTVALSFTSATAGHPRLKVAGWVTAVAAAVLNEVLGYLRGRLDDDRTVEDELRRLVNVTTEHLTLTTCLPELDDAERLSLRWRFTRASQPADGADSYPIMELGEAWRLARAGRQHLVILGSPGAGKTTAAMVLLGALAPAPDGGSEPGVDTRLPVLLSLAHWRPPPDADAAEVFLSLSAWLDRALSPGERLAGMTRPALPGSTLLRRRRILLLLDGLDEMPADVRAQALVALVTVGEQVPYILLARPEHLGGLDKADLARLVVAELLPLEPEAVCRRLTRKWPAQDREELLRRVRKGEASLRGFIEVLRSPFTAFLALKVYGECSPAEREDLLAGTRSVGQLEQDLLSQYICDVTRLRRREVRRSLLALQHRSAVIGNGWKPEKQRRWLEFLALQMTERRLSSLAWWHFAHPAADREFRAEHVRLRPQTRSAVVTLILLTGLGAAVEPTLLTHAPDAAGALLGHLPGPVARIAGPPITAYLGTLSAMATHPVMALVLPGILAGLFFAWSVRWVPQPAVTPGPSGDRVADHRWSAVRGAALAALATASVVAVCVLGAAAFGDPPTAPELRVVAAMTGVEFLVSFAALLWTSQWGRFCRVRTRLSLRRQAPWRLLQFLRHHADEGALRRVGGLYEFRAPSLLDHLSVTAVEAALGGTLANLVREKRAQQGAPTTAPDANACTQPQLARELALRLESDGDPGAADALWKLLVSRSPGALDEHLAVLEWRRRRTPPGFAGQVLRWLAPESEPVQRPASYWWDADLGNTGMEQRHPPVQLDDWPSAVGVALHTAAMAGATRSHVHSGQLLLALAREGTQADRWRGLLRHRTLRLDVELALADDVPAWGGGSISGIATTSAVRAAFHQVPEPLSPDQQLTAEQLALALISVPGSGAAQVMQHAGLSYDQLAALLRPPDATAGAPAVAP